LDRSDRLIPALLIVDHDGDRPLHRVAYLLLCLDGGCYLRLQAPGNLLPLLQIRIE
jgi:hypothetical protein